MSGSVWVSLGDAAVHIFEKNLDAWEVGQVIEAAKAEFRATKDMLATELELLNGGAPVRFNPTQPPPCTTPLTRPCPPHFHSMPMPTMSTRMAHDATLPFTRALRPHTLLPPSHTPERNSHPTSHAHATVTLSTTHFHSMSMPPSTPMAHVPSPLFRAAR